MKIDKRRSEVFNLNRNFRNYVSGKYLTGYYIFSKELSASTQDQKTLTNSALGDELADALYESSGSTYYPYIADKSSPYQGRTDLYSSVFRTYRESDFRISYANSTEPFRNRYAFTIACWVYIPDINAIDPDSDIFIYQKITPAGAANTAMEFSLEFVSTPGDNKFLFRWYPKAAPATTRTIQTNSCTNWTNPVKKGGQWVHVAVVIKAPAGGGIEYDAADEIKDYVEIYCNGYDQLVPGATFAEDWTPKDVEGDLIIGKGPYDNSALSGSPAYWNNFKVHSLAVWNTALAEDEVRSIYEAAIQFEGSGVINLPPRVYLSDLDNRGGRYPTIESTGDSRRLGKKTPHFDDTKTRLFWDYTPVDPTLVDGLDYLASFQVNDGSQKYKSPTSGSLKFLMYLSASISTSGSFAEHSLTHPLHTGSFAPLTGSRATTYDGTTATPVFNTTGSNWFTYDDADVHNSDFIVVPVMNVTQSERSAAMTPAETDVYGVIPNGLSLYADNLTFVRKGGSLAGDWEGTFNPFIDGHDGYPSNTEYIPTPSSSAAVWSDYADTGYPNYIENTPQSISVWVNPARETAAPALVARGRKTILSKGLLLYQTGASGSYDYGGSTGEPVLEQSSFEYRLQLSGAQTQTHYFAIFEVGSSWPANGLLTEYYSQNNSGATDPEDQIDFTPYRLNALLSKRTAVARVAPDQWNHIVVTWDGKVWNDVDIFVNGIKNPGGNLVDLSYSSSYFNVTVPTTQSLFIGATEFRNAKTAADYHGQFFSGAINQIAMWDVKLSDEQAYSLFAAASGSLEPYGYKFFKVSYPSLIEVDRGTEVPLGSLDPTIAQISGSLATPNSMPDIVTVGSVAREIGYDFAAWSGSSDFSDNYTPFIENESYIEDSEFYNIGTTAIPGFNSPLKDKIHVNIDITPREDLTASPTSYQGAYIYRQYGGWSEKPSDGELNTNARAGMYYWDPNNKLWSDVGTKNPNYRQGANNPKAKPMYGRRNQKRYGLGLTSSYFTASQASQFMPYNYFQSTNCMLESTLNTNVIYISSSDVEKVALRDKYMNAVNRSMSHVGLPHNHNFAPFGSRYFATSSNLLRMSNYINDPMLLEKIEIDLGSIIANQNFDNGDDYLCAQPFSMYTFFLYRQTQQKSEPAEYSAGGTTSDKTKFELDELNSGSQRELIGWSTAVFYNQFASSSLAIQAMTGSSLFDVETNNLSSIWNVPISPTSSLHADWYHAWDIDPNLFSATKRVQYTGSIKLQFTPKVCGPRAQKPSMFTAMYPWSPPGYINLSQTVQLGTAFGAGMTAAKPGYGLICPATGANNNPYIDTYDEPNDRKAYVCGTPLPSYSPWVGSNTNQTTTAHQVWDPGSFAGNGPARHNVFSWPGGSTSLPYSGSGVAQKGIALTYLVGAKLKETIETSNAAWQTGQSPWNDSGFTGNWPSQVNNFGQNYPTWATQTLWPLGDIWGMDTVTNGPNPPVGSKGTAVVVDKERKPSNSLLIDHQRYTDVMNPNTSHYPGFAASTPPVSGGLTFDDYSNEVQVNSTTFLLHPEDTLILGVEKIQVPPALLWWGIGGYYTGSSPNIPSASWSASSVDNSAGGLSLPVGQRGKGGRFYGKFADHHREHYHAGILTASFMRITSDNKSWLRLYGSLVKNNQQYSPSSGQQLTTDAVHEALHYDNPVLDQWEIASELEYTGSMRTLYITGSMTRPRRGTFRFAVSSSNTPLISGSDGSWPPNRADVGTVAYSTRIIAGENSREYGDMFSFKRNITLVDQRRVYYDSLTPIVSRLWNRDGFRAATWYSSFYQGGSVQAGAGGGTQVPSYTTTGGEWVWTRKYYYGWLMGHGTGSRAKQTSDGTISACRYFLNAWDNSGGWVNGMVPGSESPSINTLGKHYLTLNTGSTGAAIEGLSAPAVPVHGQVGNHIWPAAFPFEPRYKGIPRVLNQDYSFANNKENILKNIARPAGSGSDIAEAVANYGDFNYHFGGAGYVIDANVESAQPPAFRRADRKRASVSIVCSLNRSSMPVTDDYISYLHKRRSKNKKSCGFAIFGRGYSNQYLDVIKSVGSFIRPDQTAGTWMGTWFENDRDRARNSNSGSYGVVAKPSGFKYGLINAVEQNPTAIYRGTSFGQFRDMLEQRPYTRYFDKKINKMRRSQWVVKSKFVEPTWINPGGKLEKKEPSETQSCNLSTFSTSSLPFFDEVDLYPDGRNRGGMAADGDVNVVLTPGFQTAGGLTPRFSR